jgi:hypothetical protein
MKMIDKDEAMKMFPLALVLSMASLVAVAQADVKKVCIGEAISSRAISHGSGRNFDSAIGAGGEDCLFSANSAVGRQIDKVCHIRDVNSSDDPGGTCLLEATMRQRAIERIIAIKLIEATPLPQKTAPHGGLCE